MKMSLSYDAIKELLDILRNNDLGNGLKDLIRYFEHALVEYGFHYIQLCKKEKLNLESILEGYYGLMSNELDLFLLELRLSNLRDEYDDLYQKIANGEKLKALFIHV